MSEGLLYYSGHSDRFCHGMTLSWNEMAFFIKRHCSIAVVGINKGVHT